MRRFRVDCKYEVREFATKIDQEKESHATVEIIVPAFLLPHQAEREKAESRMTSREISGIHASLPRAPHPFRQASGRVKGEKVHRQHEKKHLCEVKNARPLFPLEAQVAVDEQSHQWGRHA